MGFSLVCTYNTCSSSSISFSLSFTQRPLRRILSGGQILTHLLVSGLRIFPGGHALLFGFLMHRRVAGLRIFPGGQGANAFINVFAAGGDAKP